MEKKVMLFLGTGGVGKTTLASLYAMKLCASASAPKVGLVTIDPSKRLKDYFGIKNYGDKVYGSLRVEVKSRESLFREFVSEALDEDQHAVKKLFENKIFNKLLGGLAVSQEFTSLYELQKITSSDADFLVVDTPPLQNSGAFLSGADTLESLFSSSLAKFFIPTEKQGVLSRIFFAARKKALSLLSSLTGNDFVNELSSFFAVVEKIRPKILRVLSDARSVLYEQTDLVMVCNANELSLAGLKISLEKISSSGFFVSKCYINKSEESFDTPKAVADRLEALVQNNPKVEFKRIERFQSPPSEYGDLMEIKRHVEF